MHEIGAARIFESIGPNRPVRRFKAYSQHRRKTVAIRGYKICNSSLGINLYDLFPIQTAQVEKIALCVVGQPFGDEILFLGDKREPCPSDRRKVSAHRSD